MKKQVSTRKDVAALAGVSETIVSYVVNQNRYVRADKRQKVLEAMEELNYQPNHFARALKGKQVKHIMLLIDQIRTEFYGELVSEIERISGDLGYLISVAVVEDTDSFVDRIIGWHIEGVIISSIKLSEQRIQRLVDARIPVIIMAGRQFEGLRGAIKIDTGLYESFQKAILYLHQSGCRNIAYIDRISHNNNFSSNSDNRYRSYCDTMKQLGMPIRVLSGCQMEGQVQQLLIKEMQTCKIDGLICRNDNMSLVALQALLRQGYRVPDDVSIIGMDNTSFARTAFPTLTTLRPNSQIIANKAMELMERYRRGEACQYAYFEPELIVRESVKPLE